MVQLHTEAMALSYFDHDGFNILSPALKEHLTKLGEVVEYEKGDLVLDYGLHADFMPIITSVSTYSSPSYGPPSCSKTGGDLDTSYNS